MLLCDITDIGDDRYSGVSATRKTNKTFCESNKMEQSQLFDVNPFEALLEDFDGEQRSPEQPNSLSTASQQPLTTSEVELEAIRAQERALLQATPTSSTTLTQPPANPSTLLEAAAQAAETAANNTGNLRNGD